MRIFLLATLLSAAVLAHTGEAPHFEFAPMVLAADAPASDLVFAPAPVSPFASFLQSAGAGLLDALMAGALGLIALLGRWLHEKSKTNRIASAGAVAFDYIESAMKHLMEGLAPDIKAALANDGVIDAKERALLIAKGVALVKAELPPWVQSALNSGFGAGLTTMLSGKVAAALDSQLDKASPQPA